MKASVLLLSAVLGCATTTSRTSANESAVRQIADDKLIAFGGNADARC